MCRKGYHLRDQGMQPVQRFVSRCAGAKSPKSRPQPGKGSPDRGSTTRRFAINTCKVPHICRTTFHTKGESSNHLREDKTMKKNLQRFGASVLAAAMVAQSVALPAAAETTKIDSSVAQSVAASAASAASAVQSLPKFTSTADLIKQTAQTLAAQGEVHELEQDDAKLEATAQSKAGMSLAALENALADAMYANAAAGKINTEAYGLNKDEMASVMAATIKTYHLSSAVTDLGYETNAAGVVTAVTFTGSSGMTSAMESMTNSDDEVIAQQADSYAQAYVAENSDTFAASAAADGHTYGEPKWYWNDTNPKDGHTHTWKETPDGYWTKTDDGWAYTAVYTCEKGDAYQKVEGTVTKDTTEAKPGVAGKTVYSASVPADKSPVKKEYKEPTTRTDDIAALPCQSHVVSKDADGNFVATFNWEMKKVEGKLEADYSNAQLFYDSETGKISVGAPVTIDWECTSITFKCAVCGEEIKTKPMQTMPVSVVVDQNDNSVYINVGGTPTLDTTSGGTGVTLVSAMDGGSWYDMQNNPVDASKVNFTYQSGDNKGKNSLLLYDSQKTAVYVDDQGNQVTNTYDVSTAQMNYYYFQLSQFNQDEAEYFGVVAPFWTSKGVQKQGEDGSITGTMGAIKVLCSIDPNDDVPPTTMAFMLNMLPQAFMSYVMNYGEALKAIRDAGLAQVAKLGDADYVTKLLILHDWISQVAEFDMGSMGDITGGGNNDPIQMTAFGALLGGGIGAKGVEYGCICLGYASAFNYMVQNLPDNKEIYKKTVDGKEVWKTADEVGDNAVVDFAQILYYCDTSDTSVAGNAFGGGMFNNVHYFNAVKVNKLQGDSQSATMTTDKDNKNWYYVDVCYDDVNTECMAQTRVENAGDLRHVNFLVSPSGLEGRYSKYYDYIDSLYDGYTYTKNKEPDKDEAGNVVMNNGKPHYSYTKADNKNETRYTDTCYEDTWFTSICSPIYFDNNYFYYVDTTTNQNLYNNMRRQQSENGNNGNSGSGSSGNNSQMQQFMKKMQNQGPDTLEARPRNANYYIRKEDSSSSGGFSMSSFTKTDDPFDIILMYYNDLKKTSSNFNDDDSNAEVLAKAGTIYKIDSSAADSNLNTECLADAAAKRIYPALVHSTALYDGKLYFNVNNAIYRMDPTSGKVEEVKEYNTVYGGIKLTKDKDGNMVPDTHFPGMSMVIMDSAQDTSSVQYLGTFMNHPLAGLTLRDSYSFATTTQQGQTVITGINTTKDQLVVSVGTNLSNTYKELVDGKAEVKTDAAGTSYANRKSYKNESWNYNPSYNQNMGSSDEKNKNEEFMWCANLVETMPMSDMVSDLSSGATTDVTVEAWCDTPAYTQARTNKYGLTKGEKKYADGALPKGHTWALDELETKSVGNNVYLCSDCHTATESTPHTVTLPDAVAGVTLTLGTTSNTYIKDDTVTLTVEKEGTDIVTVTAKNGNTDVALTEVQEAAQDEAAAQATTEKAKTVYTFTMPDGDVTISVTKAAKTYAVKVADANKDTLKITSPEADLDKVAEGTSVTVVATPKDGYTLTADGVVVTYGDNQTLKATPDTEKANTYTFAMPAGDATVSAAFEEVKKYNVTVAGTVENGTVGVEPKTAAAKDVVTVTVTPNTNFKYTDGSLKATYTDGGTKKEINDFKAVDGKENTYTFEMPAADVTVSAEFEEIATETYTVTVTKGGDGKVTVNGQETEKLEGLKSNDTVTLKINPIDTDTLLTQLAGVTVTSGKVDVSTTKVDENTYTFKMPDGDVNVSVQFTTVEYSIVTTADPAEGGTITVTVNGKSELKRAPKDAEMAVTVTPNTGYELELARHGQTSITDKVKDGGTYTVGMSDCNFEIIAEFKKIETTEPTNPSEEPQAIEAEERTVHGAAEKTTITAMAVFTCTDKNCASAQFVDATVKQTSGVTTAAVTFNGKDYTAKYGEKNGWVEENGKKYWYENGVKQGTTGRGKEIYDPDSDAWYWLDAVQGGAMTVSKDVYQESAAGQWADKPDGTGKWVRYDENGHMVKGWQTTDKGTYYFDLITGAMAKGAGDIDGVPCAFDEYTGIALDGQWLTIKGADFWYEKGVRQGLDGRGKEIYDPASDAWYWLDAVDQGKKATSKDVYQESEAGQWADRADGTGKWVRYDAQGHMIKGWSADKRYYFDPIYGTMAKGDAVIDGRTYHFDKNTGVLQ